MESTLPVCALNRDLAQLRSESGPQPLARDFPSCSKIEPNITSYASCPYRIPRRSAFSAHLVRPPTDNLCALSNLTMRKRVTALP